MRGESERSDEWESSTGATGRRLVAAAESPFRAVARRATNGMGAIDRETLTRIRLDDDWRTIQPDLRSNGRV